MMEDDMKRNGSGYFDEMPVKSGFFAGPQAGEIWESTMGKEFLILKNHDGYCSTLALNDNPHPQTMEVVSRTLKHTNPGMVGYTFNNQLSAFVKTVPEETYLDIMQAVGDRLGVKIKVSADAGEGTMDYRGECERLEILLEKWQEKCREVEARWSEVADENHDLKLKLAELGQDSNTWETIADNHVKAYQAAEEKAALYEKMYNSLLDRLFARGEAK